MPEPRILIPPPCLPISLADARRQLRVDDDLTTEDWLIRAAIAAAVQHIQDITRRVLVLTTMRQTFDGFPGSSFFGSVGMGGGTGPGPGPGPGSGCPTTRLAERRTVRVAVSVTFPSLSLTTYRWVMATTALRVLLLLPEPNMTP